MRVRVVVFASLWVHFGSLFGALLRAEAAAPAIASKKVSVSEVSFDSHIEDIQWCGSDHRTILLKTRRGRLYRSKDGGRTWVEITDLLKTSDTPASPTSPASAVATDAPAVAVDSVMVSPVDKNVVVVVGTKSNHFVSEDAAATFRRVKYADTIHNLHFHPTNPSFALASTWSPACYSKTPTQKGQNQQASGECTHKLFITKDLGRSFTQVADYVVQFAWGDPKANTQDSIFFTQHRARAGDQPRYGGWSKNVDLMVSKDFGATTSRLVYRGNKFLLSNGYFFVAKVKDAVKQTVTLLISTDGGSSFSPAKLPVEIEEKSYTVLDTSEGAIILHVNHGGEGGQDSGNVYISDAKGLRFSLSLPNNIRTSTGECEFDKVLSVEGVYLANFRDTSDRVQAGPGPSDTVASGMTNLDDNESGGLGAGPEVERKHASVARKAKVESVVRTVISFDKGGVWSYLKPPKVDSRGKRIDCPPNSCFLHLNGITRFNEYAPFYSVENALGLIMGTGNVGPHLRNEPNEINTYLSRDGGLTWIEAHKGAFIYEMGDHGGLLVMADDTKKTNQVVFSWNEGQSWYDFELGSSPLFVDNIVIEPNSSSVEFLLYGKRDGDNAGVLFHLDFAALNQQKCKGIWAADSVSSDYETWSPSDGRSTEKCILGRHVTYTRRKQTSECFNGRDFQRPRNVQVCECTIEDFECELGFAREVGSVQCIPTDAAAAAAATAAGLNSYADVADAAAAAACTSASVFYTTAYRKVPGDVCEGGWLPPKVEVPCPAHSPVSRGGKISLLLLLAVVVLMFVFNQLAKSGKLKALLRNSGFDTFSNVSYAIVGGGPQGWGGPEGGAMTSPSNRGTTMTTKYEPELKFIDEEQDDYDEAPRLTDICGNAGGLVTTPRVSDPRGDYQMTERCLNTTSGAAAPVQDLEMDEGTAPRLTTPRFDDESLELL